MSGQHFPPTYVVHGADHEREVSSARTRGRREAIKVGIAIGFALAIPVLGLIGYGLDMWRVANHEQLIRDAEARIMMLSAQEIAKYKKQSEQCAEDLTAYAGLASEVAGIEVRK